ncbi:MAG: hypothetical protein Q4A75_06650 [Peptostreptococcaceae bacterium]|nr:hypothetical protein [Peptostreptococcaceae bacterium]
MKKGKKRSLLMILCLILAVSCMDLARCQAFAEEIPGPDPSRAQSIEILQEPYRKDYLYRYDEETIDLDGLIVKVRYQDGTSEEIAAADLDRYGITTDPKQGARPDASTSELIVSINGIDAAPIPLDMVYNYTLYASIDHLRGDIEPDTPIGDIVAHKILAPANQKKTVSLRDIKYPIKLEVISSPDDSLRTEDLSVIPEIGKIVTARFIKGPSSFGRVIASVKFDGITDQGYADLKIFETYYLPVSRNTFSKIVMELPSRSGEIPPETILSDKIRAIDSTSGDPVDQVRFEFTEPNDHLEIRDGKLVVKQGKTLLPGTYSFELRTIKANYEEKIEAFTLTVDEVKKSEAPASGGTSTSPVRPAPINAPGTPVEPQAPTKVPESDKKTLQDPRTHFADHDGSRSSVRPDQSELIGEDGLPFGGLDPQRREKADGSARGASRSMGSENITSPPKTGVDHPASAKDLLLYGTALLLMILAVDLRRERDRK